MKIINISLLVISYLSVSHGWKCRDGPEHDGVINQIDAGGGKVVMTDDSGAYLLSDSKWNSLGSVGIKHVSAGKNGIWGVDSSGFVYKHLINDFIASTGQNLQQLDAGDNGVLVGVTSSSTAHCLDEDQADDFESFDSLTWVSFSEALVSISCGPTVCWGVNSDNELFYSTITSSDCTATTWTGVTGDAVLIEAGADGTVFRVDPDGSLYERTGIDSSTPSGTGWNEITDNIRHATYDNGRLWLITDSDEVKECSSSGRFCESPPQRVGASQIDAGQGLVVMTDNSYQPHILTGDQWDDLGSTSLKQISVGLAGIWGVDPSNSVFKYAGDEFIFGRGMSLLKVDAGGGHVLGVTATNELRCLTSERASAFDEQGTLTWITPTGNYMDASCNAERCWGIRTNNDVYSATVTPATCTLGTWTQVTGQTAEKVNVDQDGEVYIVNDEGEVYKRTGITDSEPTGTDWVQVEDVDNVEHATYDLSTLWLINSGGLTTKCTEGEPLSPPAQSG